MFDSLSAPAADVEINKVEYSRAAQMINQKLNILYGLNTTMEGDDENTLTLNVKGTNKAMRIDIAKMRSSISFLD